jgi:hypothetical protein
MDKSESATQSSSGLGLVTAVLLAGVTATIVNAMAAAIIIAPSRIRLALVPGRYAVAIAGSSSAFCLSVGASINRYRTRTDHVDNHSFISCQASLQCSHTLADRNFTERCLRADGPYRIL